VQTERREARTTAPEEFREGKLLGRVKQEERGRKTEKSKMQKNNDMKMQRREIRMAIKI